MQKFNLTDKDTTNKYLIQIFYFIFSAIILLSLSKTFILTWDEYFYIFDIHKNNRSEFLFGRLGFNYFHIYIQKLRLLFFDYNFDSILSQILVINIAFASLLLILISKITKALVSNAFLTTLFSPLFFLFSYDFITSATSVSAEIMMLFFILLSYYLFELYKKDNKKRFLIFSAICFGYSFEIREQAIFFIPYFIFNIFNFIRTEKKLLFIIFCFIATFTALVGPFIIFLNEGQEYINSFFYITKSANYEVNSSNFRSNLLYIYTNILSRDLFLLITSFTGIIFLSLSFLKGKGKGEIQLLYFIISLFFPSLFILFFLETVDSRYLLNFFLMQSLLAAYAFNQLHHLIIKKYKLNKFFFIISVCLLILLNFKLTTYNFISNDQKTAQDKKEYGEKLIERSDIFNNTILIIGTMSPVAQYFTIKHNLNYTIIWSGWTFPYKNLEEIVQSAKDRGDKIIIDYNYIFDSKEKVAIKKALREIQNRSKDKLLIL